MLRIVKMKKIFVKTFSAFMLFASISCSYASTLEREEENAITTKTLTSTYPVLNTGEVRLFILGNDGNNNLLTELDLKERKELSPYIIDEESSNMFQGFYYKRFVTLGDKLFLANCITNSIQEIDPQSRKIIQTYYVERPCSLITINQKVFSISYEDDRIYEIDPKSHRITQYYPYSFGANPAGLEQIQKHSVAIKSDKTLPFRGFKSLTAVGNKLWVSYFLRDTVSEIDTQSRKVTHTYCVERYPYAFAVSGKNIFVGHNDPFSTRYGSISEIDTESHQITHIYRKGIDTNIVALATIGNKLFSISSNSEDLKEIDIQSRQVTYIHSVKQIITQLIALEVVGQKLFLAEEQGSTAQLVK